MSTLQSRGWLWDLLLRLVGASKTGSKSIPVDDAIDEEAGDEGASFVTAPGGYRIRVPRSTDVSSCVGEMLPSVRAGLAVLPPLPKVVTDLLREIQDPKSTAASVAQIAASDPALAASLIRTVNAAAVGLARKISSVSEAVSYLGFGAVKSMVVRLRLEEVMMPRTEQGLLDSEDLWVHSLAVSYAADYLARRVHGVDAGFAATLGLLHDIGKLAIISQCPIEALEMKRSNDDSLAHEAQLLGVDHAGIGGDLAAKWKLPADLVQAIRYHHRPNEAFHETDPLALRQAIVVVHIANQLVKYCFTHADAVEIEQVSDQSLTMLGIKASMADLLDTKMRAAIGRAVLLADANSKRSATMPRRFLRMVTGNEALQAATANGTESRLVIDDEAISSLLEESVPVYEKNSSIAAARFESLTTEAGVVKTIGEVRAQQDALQISAESRAILALIVRSIVPNILKIATPEDKLEVGQSLAGGQLRIAFRSPALSASRRLGREASAEEVLRLAAADLANVINLGWFVRIAVSTDGSAILLERAV